MGEQLERLLSAGVRVSEGAAELLEKAENKEELAGKVIEKNLFFLERKDLEEIIAGLEKIPVPVEVRRSSDFAPLAKEYSGKVRVLEQGDISGKSRCTGTVENFVSYFNDRFERMKGMIRRRATDRTIVETDKLKSFEGKDVRIIGIVYEKRVTKNGNLLLELEDLKGNAKVIISQSDAKCFSAGKGILLDDVIAIDGRVSDPFVFAKEVVYLDMPVIREPKKTENDLAIAYISDMHIGSRFFLEKEFTRFLDWLNGNWGDKELAGKVKYIEIGGDTVDGIGVYPSQEKELVIKDIYKQYEMLDSFLSKIPDYIEVIVCPGNHDAVRRADPQPMLSGDLLKSDVVRVGSPGYVEIEGLKHLVYHGTALDGVIASLSGMSYMQPEKPMIELLKRRHLAPTYGEALIVPELRDYMVIEEEPDVLHMGHVHKNAYAFYRGTLVLNSGTFQARTDYQVRMGHVPSPGLVYVYETKSGKMNTLNFMEG